MASDPLQIERVDRGVLCLHGPLTVENVSPFINAVRREDAPTMILDFTGVPYLDSSGLGSLVSSCISCQKSGRRMALTGVFSPCPNLLCQLRGLVSSAKLSARPTIAKLSTRFLMKAFYVT